MDTIEAFLADYPLQKTNDYLHERTGGDPARVNGWFLESGHLTRAGDDVVVRMANDVLYRAGYAGQSRGPDGGAHSESEEGSFRVDHGPGPARLQRRLDR